MVSLLYLTPEEMSINELWTIEKKNNQITLQVLYGSLELNQFEIDVPTDVQLSIGNETFAFEYKENTLIFGKTIHLTPAETLIIK